MIEQLFAHSRKRFYANLEKEHLDAFYIREEKTKAGGWFMLPTA